jgi:O-antigen/teichoic acid export membrane protein
MNESQSLAERALSASKWSFLAELSSKAISPILFLVLARFLTPADFGIAIMATMVITFAQLFWDAGLSKALIQRREGIAAAADVVFWINIALAFGVYLLLVCFSDAVSELLNEPRAAAVLRVQGAQILITSFSSVPSALLQRELNFRALFSARLLQAFAPLVASIPLAIGGFGYWALVSGALTGSILQTFVVFQKSPWRPSFRFNYSLGKEIIPFGLWVAGESFLAWLYLWIDSAIVGAKLSSVDLGLYKTGDLLVSTLFGLALSPLLPVMFSTFSRLQSDKEKLNNAVMNSTILISMCSIPLGVGLFMTRHSIESALFPADWKGLADIIGLFALLHGVTWLNGAQSEAFRAAGKPDVNTKIMLAGLAYSVPLYFVFIDSGLGVFIWVRLLCTAPTFLARLLLSRMFFRISWNGYWKTMRVFFLIVAAAAAGLYLMEHLLTPWAQPAFTLMFSALFGIAVMAVYLYGRKTFLVRLVGHEKLF